MTTEPTIDDLTCALGHGVVRRVARDLSDEHDSSICERGEGGEPCEMCQWANEQERRQLERSEPGPQLWADAATVKAAILDTVDNAEFYQWMWDKNEVNADATRLEFVDAVLRRVAQLQQPPHNYPQMQMLCDYHKRRRLPAFDGECVDCARQRGR